MKVMETRELTKLYMSGSVHAVDGITMAVEQGTFTSIIGPSGSGKSTLLHMMGGLERPTSGSVLYQDKDIYAYNDNQLSVLRRRRFGFVFQNYNLVRELNGLENILLPVMLDGRRADDEYLNRLTGMLGIDDRLSHLPGAMSGGQQQRVCIARALANKPAIVFADEPTGNLDTRTGREVLALMREVCRELGTTLIMVTHDMSVAEQADTMIRIEDGVIKEVVS